MLYGDYKKNPTFLGWIRVMVLKNLFVWWGVTALCGGTLGFFLSPWIAFLISVAVLAISVFISNSFAKQGGRGFAPLFPLICGGSFSLPIWCSLVLRWIFGSQ